MGEGESERSPPETGEKKGSGSEYIGRKSSVKERRRRLFYKKKEGLVDFSTPCRCDRGVDHYGQPIWAGGRNGQKFVFHRVRGKQKSLAKGGPDTYTLLVTASKEERFLYTRTSLRRESSGPVREKYHSLCQNRAFPSSTESHEEFCYERDTSTLFKGRGEISLHTVKIGKEEGGRSGGKRLVSKSGYSARGKRRMGMARIRILVEGKGVKLTRIEPRAKTIQEREKSTERKPKRQN